VAVKIRLKRLGKIRSPHYRIVVADSRTKRDGRAIEEIGKYHPKNDPSVIEVNSDRAQYWLSVGAQPTEAVVALLKRTGDWQQFSGDTSPSGVEPQKPKKNKTDAFNAALAESGNEPTSAATKPAKKATARKEAAAEAAPAAADQAPEAAPAAADQAPEAAPAAAEQAPEAAPAEKAPPAKKAAAEKAAEAAPPAADDEVEGTPAEAQEAAAAGVADAEAPEA
jgi:small subunit ribosomal protein S16